MKFKSQQLKSLLEHGSGLGYVGDISMTGHIMGSPSAMGFKPENEIKTIIRARRAVDVASGLLGAAGEGLKRPLMRTVAKANPKLARTLFSTKLSTRGLFSDPDSPEAIKGSRALDTGISFVGQLGMHAAKEGLKNIATYTLTKMADVRNDPSRVSFDPAPFVFKAPKFSDKKEKNMKNVAGPSAYEMADIMSKKAQKGDTSLPPLSSTYVGAPQEGPSKPTSVFDSGDIDLTPGLPQHYSVNRRRRADEIESDDSFLARLKGSGVAKPAKS